MKALLDKNQHFLEVTQCNVRLKMLIFRKTSTEIGLRVLTYAFTTNVK